MSAGREEGMNKDKETKKLGAEELEKRVAPFTIYSEGSADGTTDTSTGADPTSTTLPDSGSGGSTTLPVDEQQR
jgi:hypothetical protein